MSSETPPSRLTSLLVSVSRPLFRAATQSPFLIAAGDGTLSKKKLSEWLSQDRLYAQAYIGFIGNLIALVRLPTNHVPFSHHNSSIHWRIVHALRASLDNIFRELKFFEDTAQKYELDLEVSSTDIPFGPVKATTDYIILFERFFSPVNNDDLHGSDWVLLNGLIVLWATEKCYLEAWRFAASQSDVSKPPTSDADGGALRENFIPNWTGQAFSEFVQQLEQLVDELMDEVNPSLTEDAQDECKELWEEVLDIERRFWPEV
jgi:thiaminase